MVVLCRFHETYHRIIQADKLGVLADAALTPSHRDVLIALLRFSRELLLHSTNRGSFPSVAVRWRVAGRRRSPLAAPLQPLSGLTAMPGSGRRGGRWAVGGGAGTRP